MIVKRNEALYMLSFIQKIGHIVIECTESLVIRVGKFSIFMLKSTRSVFSRRWYFGNLLDQFLEIGFFSIPVVAMTAIFTGGVMALQSYIGSGELSAETTVPALVVLAITRELSPILVGLMVAGRVSSSIAARLGTMRVTDQIDALYTLSTCPYKYLILPRIIASTVSMPFLVLIADVIGILGGTLTSVLSLKFDLTSYLNNTINFLRFDDVFSGLVKAVVFGFMVAIFGCYNGYNSRGGAEGVGKATIDAVIGASASILVSNYIMTDLFFV
ncbi:MAG: ABC transporter permease [Rickettsiales bacterium]|jgi:phospholipid/cholesterol/gamma-HCH transport system permease protein|nr:ABC transporter permease [Rickettsiales bacterium]